MSTPSPAMLRLLTAAAELRASGFSWEAVASRLRRSPAGCRRWPARYRADWEELYAAAMRHQFSEAAAEATAVLRTQLRREDAKETRDAAKALLAAAGRERRTAKPGSADPTVPQYVSTLPDDVARDLQSAAAAAARPDATD